MIIAALLAAGSAALGGGLAIAARHQPALLERTRTFAFAAAAGVVAFHLLPEVLPEQGLVALAGIAVGYALPWVLEAGARVFGPRLLHGRGLSGARVAAEIGFAALVFHSLVEALALVAASERPGQQVDLQVALVAHHAPLTAAVTLPFLELRGPRSVAARAAAVAATGILGVLLARFVPGLQDHDSPALRQATAVTAGALLHVVSDEVRPQRFGSTWERVADLAACAVGVGVAALGALLHVRSLRAAGPVLEFLHASGGMALQAAPALLAGMALDVALARMPRGRLLPRFDAVFLCFALFGPAAGALFLLLSLALSTIAGDPTARVSFEQALRERGPRLLVALVVAAGLEVSTAQVPQGPGWIGVALLLLGAARLDVAGAIAIAAVLVRKGLDPGLALALPAIAPVLRPHRSPRAIGAAVAAIAVAVVLARAGALDGASTRVASALAVLRTPVHHQLGRLPIPTACAAVLIALSLHALWREGARGWFVPLRHAGADDHGH